LEEIFILCTALITPVKVLNILPVLPSIVRILGILSISYIPLSVSAYFVNTPESIGNYQKLSDTAG
jgi:DMSO/TMAO reductase YedYZ heme-binding membrane subunit